MNGYRYTDREGTFTMEDPELVSYSYFPIANESGVLSCVTPTLGGDNKMGQNTFLLEPVSSENLHNNKSSRNFWCNIEGKGLWSATGKSAKQQAQLFLKEKEKTTLKAGIMWHKVTRVSDETGLTSQIMSFVPYSGERLELMIVTLQNNSKEPITLVPTAAIPLYARSADNIRDHRHVTSLLHRIKTTENGVIVNPTLTFDERGHQKNTVVYGVHGFAECGEMPFGFYPCAEDFIGEGGSFENPKALLSLENLVPADTYLEGYEAVGGIQFPKVTLEPGQEKNYIITMGYGSTEDILKEEAHKFSNIETCLNSLEETKEYWNQKINVGYSSASEDFDSWMHWVNFQPMLRRIYGCSFLPHHDYGKGGRGWRDLWQDCLALLIMNPDGVKQMLIDNFGGVRIDGSNATIIGSKQGEFIADRNNITRVWMDHGMWPFLTARLYIMQSGDLDILLKRTSYFKDPQAVRGEEKDTLWNTEYGNKLKDQHGTVYEGTLLEHILLQHLTAFYDVGEHNHMRLRGADWNDALDMARERGESVAFTSIYGGNLENLAQLILKLKEKGIDTISLAKDMELLLSDSTNLYDDTWKKINLLKQYCLSCMHTISGETVEIPVQELADNLLHKAEWIRNHIRETEWITDGKGHSWYNGYYDNSGNRVEGNHELGVRMMLTSQVFPIMSHTATEDQVKEIVQAADYYLYDRSVGGYRLNTNFQEVKTNLGRMFGFAYGQKENGAVFCHMAVMYANSLYQRGFAKEGYHVINSLFQHCNQFSVSRIYPGVPEYIGDNGRGLYHYLTGAASWLLLTVLTEMYGVKGNYGDLCLEPKLLKEQFDDNHTASASLVFASRNIRVQYVNENIKEYGEYKIGSIIMNDVRYQTATANVILRCDIEKLEDSKDHIITVKLV